MKKENQKELAKILYMQNNSAVEIAEKIGVSRQTVSKWITSESWEAKRAGQNITRPELVTKNLLAINQILDNYINSNDPNKNLDADKISKLAKVIENLDKKASIVDNIETFMAFNKWLQFRMSFDKEITPELIQAINKYQDLFITEQINAKCLK
jgi:predicted DNA-binding protein YlxM (UPF0122 family)